MAHKFEVGQDVKVRSGKVYRVVATRGDHHPKLGNEPGYEIKCGQINGMARFG